MEDKESATGPFNWLASVIFYVKNTIFGFTEAWSSLSQAVGSCLLYPFFVWIFSKLCVALSGSLASFTVSELLIYMGLAYLLSSTALSGCSLDEAMTDFSVNFIRPRVWLLYVGTLMFGRQWGHRCIMLLLFLLSLSLLSRNLSLTLQSAACFLIFLPLLTLIDVLISLLFCCLQINCLQIKYFRMAILKSIMVFGGVLMPLSDLQVSWQATLLKLPMADTIFQPCYYCVRGHFYGMPPQQWLFRIFLQIMVLGCLVCLIYPWARRSHQSYGG